MTFGTQKFTTETPQMDEKTIKQYSSVIEKLSNFLTIAKNTTLLNPISKDIDELNNHLTKTILTTDIENIRSEALDLVEKVRKGKENFEKKNLDDPEYNEIISDSNRQISIYKKFFEVCNANLKEIIDILFNINNKNMKKSTNSVININVNINKKCAFYSNGANKLKKSIKSSIHNDEIHLSDNEFARSIHIPDSKIKSVDKPKESKLKFRIIDKWYRSDSNATLPICYQIYPQKRSNSRFMTEKASQESLASNVYIETTTKKKTPISKFLNESMSYVNNSLN
jgi:hypothetical protein